MSSDLFQLEKWSLHQKYQQNRNTKHSINKILNIYIPQIFELEKRFLYQKYLSPADRDEIAAQLGLSNAQVKSCICICICNHICVILHFPVSQWWCFINIVISCEPDFCLVESQICSQKR